MVEMIGGRTKRFFVDQPYNSLLRQCKNTGRGNCILNKLRRALVLHQFNQLLFLMTAPTAFLLVHSASAALMFISGKKADILYLIHTKMNVQGQPA